MAIQTILSGEEIRTTSLTKINSNFTELNNSKANLSWANFTGTVSVAWNVWIWTTSPWSKLEVIWAWGGLNIASFITPYGSGAYFEEDTASIYAYRGSSTRWANIRIWNSWWSAWLWSNNDNFGIYTDYGASTEKVITINSDNNVWIWNTSPWSKLSVVWLPTSSSWLSSWDIWRDGTSLKIV